MAARWEWIGALGWKYQFEIHTLDAPLDEVQGNYIFARHNGRAWVPVYIGSGILKDLASGHPMAECIRRKGATHIHFHANEEEEDREREEADLLRGHIGAFAPSGCNE